MLGTFGSSATRVSPAEVWPTEKEMALQREYEEVLLDGLSLKEMIEAETKKQEEAKEKIRKRYEMIKMRLNSVTYCYRLGRRRSPLTLPRCQRSGRRGRRGWSSGTRWRTRSGSGGRGFWQR